MDGWIEGQLDGLMDGRLDGEDTLVLHGVMTQKMLTDTKFSLNCSCHLAWVLITVVKEGLTEMTSHLLIVLYGKMCASTSPKSRPSK